MSYAQLNSKMVSEFIHDSMGHFAGRLQLGLWSGLPPFIFAQQAQQCWAWVSVLKKSHIACEKAWTSVYK
jgi:hypothetical protein